MHTRIYILLLSLCLIGTSASAVSYGVHVPMNSTSQTMYGSASRTYTAAAPAAYAMQSTSSSRMMTSACRTSDDLAMLGNATCRFTTCVYGVGEEAPSAHYAPSRPRRVEEEGDDPSGPMENPIGEIPWVGLVVVLLLYGGYIAYRRRKSYKV